MYLKPWETACDGRLELNIILGSVEVVKIIKRSGQENTFDGNKITVAVRKANKEVNDNLRLTEEEVLAITENVTKVCSGMSIALSVEEIQDLVENELMKE